MNGYRKNSALAERPTSTFRTCAGCGAVPYAGDSYCAGCGARLIELEQRPRGGCGVCGAAVSHPVALFCTRCGAHLAEENAEL